jgi:hypothetical protein
MKHLRIVASHSAAALLGLAACSDATAPEPAQAPPPNALLGILDPIVSKLPIVGSLLGTDTVVVLQRATPLASNITVTKVIGSGGGQVSIPAAGVTLVVPSGAVDYPMLISVTALAGRGVAYEFGPHGTTFKKPLTIRQDLAVTGIDPRLISQLKFNGGYFTSQKSLLGGLLAIIEELLPATANAYNGTVQFNVNHFSGYLIAVDYYDE